MSEFKRIKQYLEENLPPDKVAIALEMLTGLLAVIETYNMLTPEEVAIILAAL